MAQRYVRTRKGERGRLLDEFCALPGCNRGYAARLLRLRACSPARPAGTRRRERSRTYGDFTRSRAERKNDNCYVEQKDWTVVRRTVG